MKFQPPKGTRDLLPEDASKLQQIIQACRNVFEKYGFKPLITPAFESFELLSAKGGLGEAVKDEIYYFKDKSDRELGLRFDLTMPLARVVSSASLPKPFKRYQIEKVWRYDNPQAKRWREFFQADIDVVGSNSLVSDIECLAATCEVLDKLGFKDYKIRVNNRKLIESFIRRIAKNRELTEGETAFRENVDSDSIKEILRIIDKKDKIGIEEVKLELNKRFNGDDIVNDINKIKSLEDLKEPVDKKELDELFDLAKEFGIYNKLKFDTALVRGLEYYTGMVYEINLGTNVSCGGGGRYDNLIEKIGGQPIPATGISLGLDRILEVMKENKMFKIEKINTKIFVANVDISVINDTIKIVKQLRENNINAQIDLMERNFGKQLEYASNLQIPYVLIVGKQELKSKKFKLKDMKTGKQRELTLKKIISLLK